MGLGGAGALGFIRPLQWIFLSIALALLPLSFYLNVVRRRTRVNVAVFAVAAVIVTAATVRAVVV